MSDSLSSSKVNGSRGVVGRSMNRYKTELCRAFEETGKCKYDQKCQFAHGIGEMRSLTRHPKYKTELCRSFHNSGVCPYGPRCHFIHDEDPNSAILVGKMPKEEKKTTQTNVDQQVDQIPPKMAKRSQPSNDQLNTVPVLPSMATPMQVQTVFIPQQTIPIVGGYPPQLVYHGGPFHVVGVPKGQPMFDPMMIKDQTAQMVQTSDPRLLQASRLQISPQFAADKKVQFAVTSETPFESQQFQEFEIAPQASDSETRAASISQQYHHSNVEFTQQHRQEWRTNVNMNEKSNQDQSYAGGKVNAFQLPVSMGVVNDVLGRPLNQQSYSKEESHNAFPDAYGHRTNQENVRGFLGDGNQPGSRNGRTGPSNRKELDSWSNASNDASLAMQLKQLGLSV